MAILSSIWNFFATYILRQAPYMIGFITLIGYALMKKKWYDILGGTRAATPTNQQRGESPCF